MQLLLKTDQGSDHQDRSSYDKEDFSFGIGFGRA